MRHQLNMARVEFAISGNEDQRLQYEADPALFMQRMGVAPAAPGAGAQEGAMSKVDIRSSPIHGQGVFSDRGVRKGEAIAKLLNKDGDDVSKVASKVNHSGEPNALPVVEAGGDIVLRAVRDVPPGNEVVSSYSYPGKS